MTRSLAAIGAAAVAIAEGEKAGRDRDPVTGIGEDEAKMVEKEKGDINDVPRRATRRYTRLVIKIKPQPKKNPGQQHIYLNTTLYGQEIECVFYILL